MRREARNYQRGLTLVEVLIALAVVAVALLPVMIGFSQALAAANQSAITTAATSIARQKVEDLKAKAYADVISEQPAPRDFRAGDSFFRVAVTVQELRADGLAHQGLKQAVVAVYRTGGAQPVVSITTYFVPLGV
jgi:prepilin-type N-terminal cleavage/methylation domain-containing protein